MQTIVPTTDDQVETLLEQLPVSLEIYRLQREKGLSVTESWDILQQLQGNGRSNEQKPSFRNS